MGSVRKELRKQHNLLIEVDQIAETLWGMLGKDAQTQIGQMKLKKQKKAQTKSSRSLGMEGTVSTKEKETTTSVATPQMAPLPDLAQVATTHFSASKPS